MGYISVLTHNCVFVYLKEGLTMKFPLLDGSYNYVLWRARMKAYIRSIDERAWRMISEDWKPSLKDADGDYVLVNLNAQVMNAFMATMDMYVFRLISHCSEAKEAWDILEYSYQPRYANFTKKRKDRPCSSDQSDEEIDPSRKEGEHMCSSSGQKSMEDVPEPVPDSVHTTVPSDETQGNIHRCLVTHASLLAVPNSKWYFDSACSRHMTGNASLLRNIRKCSSEFVTFGNGARVAVLGRDQLNVGGMPHFDDVMLVQDLKSNLLSVSHLCDHNLHVMFTKQRCKVVDENNKEIMSGLRSLDNCYLFGDDSVCLLSQQCEADLWHAKLGHISARNFGSCQIGKQTRAIHKAVTRITTSGTLELLHMDLMGPVQNESLGRKRYIFVCVDDFSRFTWIEFLREKSETFEVFKNLVLKLERTKECGVNRIRSDHGREFDNAYFEDFCNEKGISQEFSVPKTPQQNGVVERKNRTLQEMTRVMMKAKGVANHFWVEAMNTACYIINRVYLRSKTDKTPYELWKGRKPNVKHLHIFGCRCYVLRDREQRAKLGAKSYVLRDLEIAVLIGCLTHELKPSWNQSMWWLMMNQTLLLQRAKFRLLHTLLVKA